MRKICSGLAFGRAGAFILLAAVVASYGSISASAYYFEGYVSWVNSALQGIPTNTSCSSAATDFLDFVYALVQEKPPTVGTASLTQACTQCSTALDSTLQYLPASQPDVCPLLPSPPASNLTVVSLRRFVCLGQNSGGAGACVVQATNALRTAGLLIPVRLQDPSLRFTGDVLSKMCSAFFPPPPAPPSCCPRTWAYLMAALASQSCLPQLAHEYLSLTGRCSVLMNQTLPGFCESSWPADLLPLLAPPPACSTTQGASVPSWANGTACSADQLNMKGSASSSCDLWCGVVGTMDMVDNGVIPTPGGGGNNGTTSGTDGDNSNDDDGEQMQTATIVIVVIFSILIAILLLALAVYGWKMYKEKKEIERERFEFDADLIFPPAGISPGDDKTGKRFLADSYAAANAAEGGGSAAATGQDAPAGAAAAAVAAGTAAAAAATKCPSPTTPRYPPGPTGSGSGGLATYSAGPDRAATASRQISYAAVGGVATIATDRTGSSSGLMRQGTAGGIGRTSITSRASSSRYESATSVFPKSAGPASTVLATPPGMAPVGPMSVVDPGTSGMLVVGTPGAQSGRMAVLSHPVSLSGSDTSIYVTAQSPLHDAFMMGAPGETAADRLQSHALSLTHSDTSLYEETNSPFVTVMIGGQSHQGEGSTWAGGSAVAGSPSGRRSPPNLQQAGPSGGASGSGSAGLQGRR